nr:putative reverse transcriptase domain-containing protein [Tanacetum cinerariifolium]
MAYTSHGSSSSDTKSNEKSDLNDAHVNESQMTGNSLIDSHESDGEDNQVNDRFKKSEGYHAVPPPYTGNYMPPRADLSFAGFDDSVFKFAISETVTSVNETETSTSKTSKESLEKPKTVSPSALIIEEWESDSEDENVVEKTKVKKQSNLALKRLNLLMLGIQLLKMKAKLKNLRSLDRVLGNKEEHKEHLKLILELLKKEEFYAKFSKCEFYIPKIVLAVAPTTLSSRMELIDKLWAFPLKMPLSTIFITPDTFLITHSSSLVVTSVSIAKTPAILGQVANLVALVTLWYTRAIMMVVALGTFWQRSTILPLLTRPNSISPASVLPHVLLLLVLVVSEVIILQPFVFNLTFSQNFYMKFYNSLGRAPNRCSSSIGKTRGFVIVHSRN